VAQRTRSLRFGPLVWAMPLHHPLRLIEEICMLDQLSGGRLEIGFGRGSVPIEIEYYGANPDEAQEIYAEAVELVLKGLTHKVLDFEGKRFAFRNVPMEIEPLQKPHPPLWYGAHSPDSAERAARKGLHMVTNDMPAPTRAMIARYRQVWRELHGAAAVLPKMGVVRFIVVADSDAKAMTIARRAYLRWRTSFTHLFKKFGTAPQSPLNVNSFDDLIKQGQAIAGSPETVRTFLAAQLMDNGANYVVGQLCFGDLTLDEMLRSVELFSAQVMPTLRAGQRTAKELAS
jgi:alkanesulfonate monooxygenase SsuD/methylene tetrahydromethanopterin reductase-like flavin-dependent oxidoreductase (luciferase family)